MTRITFRLASLICVLVPTGLAVAGDHVHHHEASPSRPALKQTHQTAGYPLCVSSLAIPSDTGHYRGGYVGGGSVHGGHDRTSQEGTWGWDYTGLRPRGTRIFNGWSHGHRLQGGFGAYKTDGPRPLEELKEKIHGSEGHE